jgi:hypothetical protein
MCVQVTKTGNRFEISSLLEKILLKQVRWCLTFVGLYSSRTVALNIHFLIFLFILDSTASYLSIPVFSFQFQVVFSKTCLHNNVQK